MTRRRALLTLSAATAAAAAPAEPPDVPARIVERNDLGVDYYLRAQITAAASPWLGSVPDDYLLHPAGSAAGLIETLTSSLLYPRSKHFQQSVLVDRIRLAAAFLQRSQTTEGNIDLLSTNFNSPPDTGFVVHNVATAAAIARRYSQDEVLAGCGKTLFRPLLSPASC